MLLPLVSEGRGTSAPTRAPAVNSSPSQSPVSGGTLPEETAAWHEISNFLHENAYDLVVLKATAFEKKFPSSNLKTQVAIAHATALYEQGADPEALAILNGISSGGTPGETEFWQGEVMLNMSKWPEAEQKFRASLATNNSLHSDDSKLGLAWALFSQSKDPEANQILTDLASKKEGKASGQMAELLLGKLALSRNDSDAAIKHLSPILDQSPDLKTAFETEYWLGEAELAAGQFASASKVLEKITTDDRAFPEKLVAQANLALGQCQEALGHEELALTNFQTAFEHTASPEVRSEAFTAYLTAANGAKKLPDAVARLQDFAKQNPAAGGDALFAIAWSLASTHADDAKAISTLESLVKTGVKGAQGAQAEHLLGQLYLRTGNLDGSQRAFDACLKLSPDPAMARDCDFQLGLAAFQSSQWSSAIDHFKKVVTDQANDALAEQASYNCILAQVHLKQVDAAQQSEATFVHQFPKSTYLAQLATAQGDLLFSLGRNDEAREAYKKGLSPDATDSGQRLLLKHLADFLYQTGSTDQAALTWQAMVNRFPDDSIEATERGLQASYENQKITDSQYVQALQALAQKYAGSPASAEILFRLGELYFYQQDYVLAQNTLQQVATTYPDSPYSGDACFFAGQAAAAHQDLASAETFFSSVPSSSSFAPEARIWLAKSLHDQLKFQEAADAYEKVLASEKSGPRFVEANLGLGECYFELAQQDQANYSKAISAFAGVLASNDGTPAQRNQAGVREGKCLEKSGKEYEALALYLDVLYDRLAVPDKSGSAPAGTLTGTAPQPVPPDLKWLILGGWEAARIRESQKDWRSAIEIYQRLEQIGGSDRQAFHDLVNKIRREHYIFD